MLQAVGIGHVKRIEKPPSVATLTVVCLLKLFRLAFMRKILGTLSGLSTATKSVTAWLYFTAEGNTRCIVLE